MSVMMVNGNGENTVTDNWIEGGYYPVNGGDPANSSMNVGTWLRNKFDKMRYDNPSLLYSGAGNFDKTPRVTLTFSAGAILNAGVGTSNANIFASDSTVPGVIAGAEVSIR